MRPLNIAGRHSSPKPLTDSGFKSGGVAANPPAYFPTFFPPAHVADLGWLARS